MFKWLPRLWRIRKESGTSDTLNAITQSPSNYLKTFQAGDVALVRSVLKPDRVYLTSPLTPGKDAQSPFGLFPHDRVLGMPARMRSDIKGQRLLVTHPTYEEYMINRRRGAQPIYPLDAALIVSLADIHVDVINSELGEATAHFLEAGTGHGSLTLSICKALHCANPPGRTRGALLHSIDKNESHSRTGYQNIKDFRRGMYLRDVEFYVDESPRAWLRKHPIELSGAFLDLPNSSPEILKVGEALKIDAPLLVFCPQISQIQDLERQISESKPRILTLINVVEIMPGMGGSLRSWDLRTTRTRESGEAVSICRPRVGARVVGGGFVAIFRRTPFWDENNDNNDSKDSSDADTVRD
jgi:tRNA (adenine57-N1/adenine58-N1)-methyltransferase catalytic subunit